MPKVRKIQAAVVQGRVQRRSGAQDQAHRAADQREPQRGACAIGKRLCVGANGFGEQGEYLAEKGQHDHHEDQSRNQRSVAALLAAPVARPKGNEHGSERAGAPVLSYSVRLR